MDKVMLDEVQLEIVNSPYSNIIVDAGAGSGKTRVLTERVRRLLLEGASPSSMVVITFTKLAAEELQERLSDVANIENCFIGTIHALANKLLSSTDTYDIFSQYYQDMYMKYLITNYAKYCTWQDYNNLMNQFKDFRSGIIDYADIVGTFSKEVLDELYILLGTDAQHNILDPECYPYDVMSLCEINNVITFDELLHRCNEYFCGSGVGIQYLFVDELQDIGYLEYDFLLNLNATNNFFIGDDYQSIYEFKGGDVNIFLSLLKDPNWKSYYMTNNYRNGLTIMTFANKIIANADNIIAKGTTCKSGKVGKIEIKNKLEISKFFRNFLNIYNSYKDWFILTRTNKDLEFLADLLRKNNIPFISFKQGEISKAEKDDALQQNAIKLLTIHASKGSESDNVLLYGNFPITYRKNIESEEVKVFYVGITRAQNNLIIFNGK